MLVEPRERLLRLFEQRIYNESFKDLSGWDRAAIGAPSPEILLSFSSSDLKRYLFDRELPNECLESAKGQITNLTSVREQVHVEEGNILLTPGATAALAVVLHFVRATGIKLVLTDPPFYFSVKKLCDALGMTFMSVNRSVEDLDDYDRILRLIDSQRHLRKAVILAHPRYVISRNYPAFVLSNVRKALNQDDFLIIDQSVDMEFQNSANFVVFDSMSVKIRTIGKALAFNGSRLAVVIANRELIAQMDRQAGILYGSLDVAMLKLGALIAHSPDLFEVNLNATRKIVQETVLEARQILGGSIFEVVKPENGFLGYILVELAKIGRFALYDNLLRQSVHAMFSAHIGLRQSYKSELIRVNYLLNLRDGLMVLKKLSDQSQRTALRA